LISPGPTLAKFGGAIITPAAPAAFAAWVRSTVTSVPSCDAPTITGMRPPIACIAVAVSRSRSASLRRGASPATPRIVMPCTPACTVLSSSVANDSSSSLPRSSNGVETMT
jgi:hypothetical protein